MGRQNATVLKAQPGVDFVETPYIRKMTSRALDYIKAGFPLNLSGPTGVGKTTLALHLAAQLNRPSVLISGDHEFNTSDLVGGVSGYRKTYVKDNFIRSVLKTDENMTQHWVDSRLTTACKHGFTLVYDEFTRSRPEANNVLLSILEERILPIPAARGGESYLRVHPDFAAIFTSNPEEYVGVYKSQDALRDRMITIELGNFDEETEVAITKSKSGISGEWARHIVRMVRQVREVKENRHTPTVRACVMIGKVLCLRHDIGQETFGRTCRDILIPEIPPEEREYADRVITEVCSGAAPGEDVPAAVSSC